MNPGGVRELIRDPLAAVRRVAREHGRREVAAIVFRHGRLWWGVLVYRLAGCVRIAGLRFRLEGPCFPLWRRSGYWFRDYEHVEMAAVRRWLRRDLATLELGGGLGGVACLTDRLMEQPERHVVVEANPAMWELLETNRRLNGARFTLVRAALGYGGAEVVFHRHPSYFEVGSLQPGPEETVRVPATTVAALLGEHNLGVCNLVADIEGGEVALVAREGELLAERVAVAVLELHPHLVGERPITALLRRLVRLGFRIVGHRYHGPALVVSLVNVRCWPPVTHHPPPPAAEANAGPAPGTLASRVRTALRLWREGGPRKLCAALPLGLYDAVATPLTRLLNGRATFRLGGRSYPYCLAAYNRSWSNERTVELALVQPLADACRGRLLEVGNVLAHYGTRGHVVVDKYEVAPGVTNADVADYAPEEPFDLIVSISTLEHVGFDEEAQDPDKLRRAVARLAGMLRPGGRLVATLPLAYNPHLDAWLRSAEQPFDEVRYLRRGWFNRWSECTAAEAAAAPYNHRRCHANALALAAVARPEG